MNWNDPHWIAFGAYLILVLVIGVMSAKFSSGGVGEFFVGGRTMSRFVVALSAVVSARSAWVFLGLVGLAYTQGASAVWYVVGFIVAEMLLFFFFAPRIRKFSGKYDCITVPDFLAARFGDRAGLLRLVCVAVILLFVLPYIASQFIGGGKSLVVAFKMDANTGLMITAGVVMAYTLLGGFLAVSLTDTIQACFMIFGLVALPIIIISQEGGFAAMLSALDPGFIDPTKIAIGALAGALGLGLGSAGNPHITARYMSIKDPSGLRFAGVLGTVWCVVMCWGAIFVGISGKAMVPDVSALPDAKADNLFPYLTELLLHPVLAGVVLAAIFAAIMSTADSQLLVAASAIVRDIYQKVLRKGADISQRALVLISRIVVLLLVVFAVIFGIRFGGGLHDLIVFAWSGPGASLGPVLLLAVFWKRMTWLGALGGILAGATTVILWVNAKFMVDGTEQSLKTMYVDEIVPGFFASLITCIVLSLLTKPPDDAEAAVGAMNPKPVPTLEEREEIAA